MKLSHIHAILEARSHSDRNPKISLNQYLYSALDAAKKDRIADGVWNCFVSLTALDKLGINPQSEYDTPIGIYAYPGQFVYSKIGMDDELDGAVPFAGEQPYANIFSAQGNIINVASIEESDVMALYRKIGEVYHKYSKQSWKTDVDTVERIINEASTQAKQRSIPGGQLWYVTMKVAELLNGITGTAIPVIWNKLFREIGVDGVVDAKNGKRGSGIIHTNEPTQAVFFSTAAIAKVDRVANKYSPQAVQGRVAKGAENKAMQASLSGLSDQEIINRIATEGGEIILRGFKNPSEAVQLAAVEDSPYNIKYIRTPSEKAKLMAVQQTGSTIRFIKQPSEQVQIAAVQSSSTAIRLIDNPSIAVQIASVTAHPHSIASIKEPTESVQMAAVHAKPTVINYIKQPTEKVKRFVSQIMNRA